MSKSKLINVFVLWIWFDDKMGTDIDKRKDQNITTKTKILQLIHNISLNKLFIFKDVSLRIDTSMFLSGMYLLIHTITSMLF